MAKLTKFRQKEVINIKDGKRLGFVCDVEIDPDTGMTQAIIIPKMSRLFGLFGKSTDYVVKWEEIKKVGDDIIIVEFETD